MIEHHSDQIWPSPISLPTGIATTTPVSSAAQLKTLPTSNLAVAETSPVEETTSSKQNGTVTVILLFPSMFYFYMHS